MILNNAASRAWLILMIATGITWWLGDSGTAARVSGLPVFIMLGLAYSKGFLVIYDFMELRHARVFWKLLIIGWLTVVLGMIALAYWMGLH